MSWKSIIQFFGWVISIALAIILYVKADKHPEPVFSTIKSPSLIFDNTLSSSKIKVLREDGETITNNVYITTIALWNKGKEAINHADIRTPFYIVCNDTIGIILEAKIIQENDPAESNFTITGKAEGLLLNWDYFDPSNGCKIQVIYTGIEQTELVITGKVGRFPVQKVVTLPYEERFLKYISIIIYSGWLLCIFGMIYIYKLDPNKDRRKFYVLIGTIVVLVIIMVMWFLTHKDQTLAVSIPF